MSAQKCMVFIIEKKQDWMTAMTATAICEWIATLTEPFASCMSIRDNSEIIEDVCVLPSTIIACIFNDNFYFTPSQTYTIHLLGRKQNFVLWDISLRYSFITSLHFFCKKCSNITNKIHLFGIQPFKIIWKTSCCSVIRKKQWNTLKQKNYLENFFGVLFGWRRIYFLEVYSIYWLIFIIPLCYCSISL